MMATGGAVPILPLVDRERQQSARSGIWPNAGCRGKEEEGEGFQPALALLRPRAEEEGGHGASRPLRREHQDRLSWKPTVRGQIALDRNSMMCRGAG